MSPFSGAGRVVLAYRVLLCLSAAHVLLAALPTVRKMAGVSDRVLSVTATAMAPLFGVAIGMPMVLGEPAGLMNVVGLYSAEGAATKISLSPRCTMLSGMSIVVYLFFAIVVYERVLRETVLPFTFPHFWAELTEAKRAKLVGSVVALNVRFAGLVALTPSLLYNFSLDGLEYNATDGQRCEPMAPDRLYAAGFYSAGCWLVTLLIWEVAYLPNLQWDDWVHHLVSAILLTWYNDNTLQSREDDSGLPIIVQHPAVSGLFFVMLLGGTIACFNYVTLIFYHMKAGEPEAQAYAMGIAAIFSWGWQVPLFLYYPFRILVRHAGELGSGSVVLWGAVAAGMFVVDSKCNVVRVQIMREKFKIAAEAARGVGGATHAVCLAVEQEPRGRTDAGDEDDEGKEQPTRIRSHPASMTTWDETLSSQSGMRTRGWVEVASAWLASGTKPKLS